MNQIDIPSVVSEMIAGRSSMTSAELVRVEYRMVAIPIVRVTNDDGSTEMFSGEETSAGICEGAFRTPVDLLHMPFVEVEDEVERFALQMNMMFVGSAKAALTSNLLYNFRGISQLNAQTHMIAVPVRIQRVYDATLHVEVSDDDLVKAMICGPDAFMDRLTEILVEKDCLDVIADELIRNNDAGDYDAMDSGVTVMLPSKMEEIETEFENGKPALAKTLQSLRIRMAGRR